MVLGSVPVRQGPAYRSWSYTGQIQNGIGTGGCSAESAWRSWYEEGY